MAGEVEGIINLISRADQGELIDEANEELKYLCEAITRNGGKGQVKITIEVAEIKGKDAVEVTVHLDSKLPKPVRMSRPYFLTANFELTRKHGAQPGLPLDDDDSTDDGGVIHRLTGKPKH